MPFLTLLLVDSLYSAAGLFARRMAALLLASILAWTPVLGWQSWTDACQFGHLADFDFATVRNRLSYSNASTVVMFAKLSGNGSTRLLKQADQLMDMVSKRGEPFVVMDRLFLLQPHHAHSAWSAIYGPANFLFMPPTLRREFLQNTAQHLGLAGWVIVQRNRGFEPLVADYDAVYHRTDEIDLGAYSAIRFALPSSKGLIPRVTAPLQPQLSK